MAIQTDFLVIGSGIAGLMYALDVAEHGTVAVIAKDEPGEGSTRYAQGGIASVTSPADSFKSHIDDTIDCGAGLCKQAIVELVVTQGPERIQKLIQLGAQFDRDDGSDDFQLGQEGGHSARRILHARDATGAEIHRAIFAKILQHPNIEIFPYHVAIDFMTSRHLGREQEPTTVYGAYALKEFGGEIQLFSSRVTMLATGGAGKAYLYTSNPDVATGDGIAMSFRAGAEIANMEFFQFHPTCLFHPEAKSFLITEALRGEGAKLLTRSGSPFMHEYDKRAELAPRDIVARAIDEQMKKTGDDFVMLDVSHLDETFIKERFPTIVDVTNSYGFDICKAPIPVVPAAHYCCGGVLTDKHGRTSLRNLYASGETSCTGLHGANRLASNSLLEAVVFSHRAARHSVEHLTYVKAVESPPEWDSLNNPSSSEEVLLSHIWDEVRRTMWNLVGIVRSDHRLNLAARRMNSLWDEIQNYYWSYRITKDLIEVRNITTVAKLIIGCASRRKESRGLHYNIDSPEPSDEYLADTIVNIENFELFAD